MATVTMCAYPPCRQPAAVGLTIVSSDGSKTLPLCHRCAEIAIAFVARQRIRLIDVREPS